MRRVLSLATRALGAALVVTGPALGQSSPPPTAAFPEPAPTAPPGPAPAPAQPPPAYAPPAAAPPAAAPAPPAYAPPPTAAPPPAPAYEPPPPVYEPPPPPPPEPPPKRAIPTLSFRIDPFNLLIDGKLGIEMEAEVLKWMSVELVPIFVVNNTPPAFGYFTGPHGLKRDSNGIGPLAGTSVDVGFWLNGRTMEGNVLRVILTDYGYEYSAPLDKVSHVERQLFGYFGSHSRWGAFTLAGGIGLGAELHKQRRCYLPDNPSASPSQWTFHPSNQCEDNALFLRTDKTSIKGVAPSVVDLSGGLAGIQLMFRISLGVVF